MRYSIATVSISGTLEEKLPVIAAAGFDGVEIFENDLITFPGPPSQIRTMLGDLGLACSLFQPFRDYEGLPDGQRAKALDRAERKFALMCELGANLMLVCSNCSPEALPDRSRILDDFAALGELAARYDVRVGYEALAWGRHVNDHRDAWSIVRDIDHPNVGLILDSFHSLARGIPSSSIGDIRSDKLFLVQLADAPRLDMDFLSWSRHFRNFPGQGDLPVNEFVAALLRAGFDDWWSLEIFNDRFRGANAAMIARDGLRSLHALRDVVARQPTNIVQPSIAPPTATGGIAFIEFAVDLSEHAQLCTIIGALGFQQVARHRSKQVDLWRQGDINLVLNCEPEGFAHSFNVMHGGSVCAIGLLVDNVVEAQARAEVLAITPFTQQVAHGEYDIPSLRGIGGSLIYLVARGTEQAIWQSEFIFAANDEAGDTGIGMIGVDHLAYTMPYDEFLSWALFFVAQFGMSKTPIVNIPDPLGLVQSQALENDDRSVRLTLNGSDARQTLSSRFVHNYFGAGLQHIAFQARDAVAAARSARAAGLEILPIPENYYADVVARFGLDEATATILAENDILYDRDGESEYLQFYSRAFGKRVFFEVVERRGYDGYGANNASVRLAAQSRFKPTMPESL